MIQTIQQGQLLILPEENETNSNNEQLLIVFSCKFEKINMSIKLSTLTFSILLTAISCEGIKTPPIEKEANYTLDVEIEKKAILETLNNETKAAFQRDYEGWKEKWVHDSDISKIYIDFSDSTFSEAVGWNEISNFVRIFIEEHPEPEPVPKLLDTIEVRIYGTGAWVTYEQHDSLRGLKRESRLMEKVNGEWKIAGMQTTIYGLEAQEYQ